MKTSLYFCLIALVASGCTTTSWSLINNSNSNVDFGHITFNLPKNWSRQNSTSDFYRTVIRGARSSIKIRQILLSLNGMGIEHIVIREFDIDNAFPWIEKSVDDSVLSIELADLWIAEFKTRIDQDYLNITRHEPVKIAGTTGFLIEFETSNSIGMKTIHSAYGILVKDKFYTFFMNAPAIHFFEQAYPDFKNLVRSVSK